MQKKVLIITTGGTVVSPSGEHGAAPDAKRTDDVLSLVSDYFESNGMLSVAVRIFGDSGLDSSDIAPKDWVRIAREIDAQAGPDLAGALVVHGTDTMAYTAAWLALCFSDAEFPVVLTGSQRTPDVIPTDGPTNLLGAASMIENAIPGVWVYFDWKIHMGGHVHKKSAAHADAFVSVGMPSFDLMAELAKVKETPRFTCAIGKTNRKTIFARSDEALKAASDAVAFFFAQPGRRFVSAGQEKILILCGFGAGNIPRCLHEEIVAAYPDEKPLIIACSQAESGKKNPAAYRNVGIANLAANGFRVWSQGEYPIEFITALAHCANFSGDTESVLSRYLERL